MTDQMRLHREITQYLTFDVPHKKVPIVLSRCHMTPTFQQKKLKKLFPKKYLKSRCHTKRRAGAATQKGPEWPETFLHDAVSRENNSLPNF